jgi:hypothetical protein
MTLMQKARQNRIAALETLQRRRDNIFLLEDARAARTRRGDAAVFIRRPAAAAPAPAPAAPPAPARHAA